MTPATRTASRNVTSGGSEFRISTNAVPIPPKMISICTNCVWFTAFAPPDAV
jgi:hypothetical protein